jgi:hypothetical protein
MRILRILQSQSLPCRCFVGVYETYDGQTVRIIEEQGRGCREASHRPGCIVRRRQQAEAAPDRFRDMGTPGR